MASRKPPEPVPAESGALTMLPTPVSRAAPVPG